MKCAALVSAVLICLAHPTFVDAAPDKAADKIRSVEQGLRPAVVVAGEAAVTRSLSDEMKRLHVPGVSIAVLRAGQIDWARGYGFTRAGGPPVTKNTLFQAGSISKPVAATAALRLVQAGRLSLDADVNTGLKDWKLPTAPYPLVTLRQLLGHTAGTTVHGFPGYPRGARLPTVVEVLSGQAPANTKPVVVDNAPGSAWRYSGGGYTVVQKLIGDATAQPFDQALVAEVLEPAGMRRSRFSQPLDAEWLNSVAMPHDGTGRLIAGGPHTYPELAAAGLWSTPSDLARFAIAVHRSAQGKEGALLGTRLSRAMLTPGKGGYGLGFEVKGPPENRSFSHGGSNAGYENILVAYAGSGDGAVVMTNATQGNELAGEIIRNIAAAYGWPSYQAIERRSIAIPADVQRRRVGEYQIPGLGSFVIAQDAVGLTLSLKEGVQEKLLAMDDQTYFVLSQDLLVRFEKGTTASGGRIVSGPFDLAFTRRP